MNTTAASPPTELRKQYHATGYALARALFNQGEIEQIRALFEAMHRDGVPGHYERATVEEVGDDILKAYPRVMNPHRFNDVVRAWLCDPRLAAVLFELMDEEPIGAQSMYYFKPPGARGQSLHQDNFYLQVRPGNCIAAWIAADHCDRENGGMMVVAGTQDHEIDCSKLGQAGSYDGGPGIRVPEGFEVILPEMAPGDVLFFNGNLIHGSGNNLSKTRWRRALIFHYAGASSCEVISKHYHPLIAMNGEDVTRGETTDGGPCGGFVGAAH